MMLNFILFLFLFLFGCLVGGVLAFLFFIKKKIALHSDKIENKKEYFAILNRHNKIEKELVEYKNEFNNKYVDDGYDAY
tara:strand:- start:571 stop:807 length:237 start_codon:yes stop_codon:yes gene_type:complete